MGRQTKIIATIGPTSQNKSTVSKLILAGVDVFRINFSHGDHRQHRKFINSIRETAASLGKSIPILQDLQGPKIRVREFSNGFIDLLDKTNIRITSRNLLGNQELISVDIPSIESIVTPGSKILFDDGKICLQAERIKGDEVYATIIRGGRLYSRKGMNLPGVTLPISGFTKKDHVDLKFGLENGIDILAISFVRSPNDIITVKAAIASLNPERADTPVIAKIERPEAIENLQTITAVADGVMVARGDLAIELSPEDVPIAQKEIIETANKLSKIAITATQMLDSMIYYPNPTRAEASDVANAIFDGTDAVLLSGETAAGKYPVEAVKVMDSIIRKAELNSDRWSRWNGIPVPRSSEDDAFYLTQSVRELVHDQNVSAIGIFTISGRTAELMSKAHPKVDILAFTPNNNVFSRLNILWGVKAYLINPVSSLDEMVAVLDNQMKESGHIKPGEQVVLVCGYPIYKSGPANLMLLHTVCCK